MKKEAYFRLMKVAEMSPEDDKTYTSSVNALAALLSAAGIGTSLSGGSQGKTVGGALTGVGVGGASAYHLARLLKAGWVGRLLSTIIGAGAGGVAGGIAGANLDGGQLPARRVWIENQVPVAVGGQIHLTDKYGYGWDPTFNVNLNTQRPIPVSVRQE